MEFLKRWIRNVIYPQPPQPSSTRLGDMFLDAGAAFVAFKIENGYVVRVHHHQHGVSGGGFTYCADHQAIADHIVAAAARDKLGVQGTLDLRAKTPNTGIISGSSPIPNRIFTI